IMAGFNGTHRAKTSNRAQNPLLQDIAVGWLQKYRTNAPARVMDSFTAKDGTVTDKIIDLQLTERVIVKELDGALHVNHALEPTLPGVLPRPTEIYFHGERIK
ncbi:phage major capsid protein, P2 family, partial [Yersinia aldovae]